ncbi:MAG TPA: DUF4097 family beta strand repeat-containing protein [Gemmatimonadaceae bacterium]|nr:DUF4097 family beta strand repeat-containing protein [Gemmatimonadaceae bacterium]
MRRRLQTLGTILAAWLCVADTLHAQQRERDLERLGERIGRSVEQAIEQAVRALENAFSTLDRTWGKEGQSGEKVDTVFAFAADGVVDLTALSGDIVVTGWTRREARVRAWTEAGRLRWRFTPSRITLETERVRGRSGDTKYDLTVPEGARLVVRTMSGDVSVRTVKGGVDVSSLSGTVRLLDGGGSVDVESMSGDVSVVRCRCDVRAGAVSGKIGIEDVEGSIRAETTSGEIEIADVRSEDLLASTVSGDVSYRGPLAPRGRYEFRAHSGSIELFVPPNSSGRFDIRTYSGSFDTELAVTLEAGQSARSRPRAMTFTLGGGDAVVIAETFSGNVVLGRDRRR